MCPSARSSLRHWAKLKLLFVVQRSICLCAIYTGCKLILNLCNNCFGCGLLLISKQSSECGWVVYFCMKSSKLNLWWLISFCVHSKLFSSRWYILVHGDTSMCHVCPCNWDTSDVILMEHYVRFVCEERVSLCAKSFVTATKCFMALVISLVIVGYVNNISLLIFWKCVIELSR